MIIVTELGFITSLPGHHMTHPGKGGGDDQYKSSIIKKFAGCKKKGKGCKRESPIKLSKEQGANIDQI